MAEKGAENSMAQLMDHGAGPGDQVKISFEAEKSHGAFFKKIRTEMNQPAEQEKGNHKYNCLA